jgi:hypothetical protein
VYDFAITLCILAAVGLISIGLLALVAPRRLSRSYGAEVDDDSAYVFVRATGVRDLIIGAIFAATLTRNDARMLLYLCGAGFALSIADLLLAAAYARGFRSEHLAHAGGAAGFAIIAIALVVGTRP